MDATIESPPFRTNVAYDVDRVRADFPILNRTVRDKPLVFLDSAASAQKPQAVIDAVSRCYEHEYANIHRGVYYLSEVATQQFEEARETVRRFINARGSREIVFTRGATEAINLVAMSYGGVNFSAGDEILLSTLEHHSNIVPWQLIAERVGARVRAVPIDDDGRFLFDAYERLLTSKTKLVAVTHGSNALGVLPPVRDIVRAAHERGVPVLIDGCQGVVHMGVDVQALDCDFYVFSGHKLYGPSGIGVLYGKAEHLEAMPPYQGGGEMIRSVSFEGTTFAEIPHRFEAGTPHISGAIGLGAAIDYVAALEPDAIATHEQRLLAYATSRLAEIDGVRLLGTKGAKASILSFLVDGVHPHDVGTVLDQAGVAVRAGHHCAQPLMERFGITGTVRASFGLYNRPEEIDVLAAALESVKEYFG